MTKYTPDCPQALWLRQFLDGAEPPKDELTFRRGLWQNILNPNSLRLTDGGWKWVQSTKRFQSYRFKLDKKMSNRVLLNLDRLISEPYHITNRHYITVLGEQDAIMLSLHANNLEQYLETLKG